MMLYALMTKEPIQNETLKSCSASPEFSSWCALQDLEKISICSSLVALKSGRIADSGMSLTDKTAHCGPGVFGALKAEMSMDGGSFRTLILIIHHILLIVRHLTLEGWRISRKDVFDSCCSWKVLNRFIALSKGRMQRRQRVLKQILR
jgi:hypothetical protein